MRQLLRRVWHLLRQRRLEADLAEEMEFHREMKQRELEARGVESTEAYVATRRALGSTALARDHARDVWIWPWLQSVAQDLRFALRDVVRHPTFSAAVFVMLALGIGANTAMFSLVDAVLFRPLPGINTPDQLISVYTGDRRSGRQFQGVPYPDFLDLRSVPHARLATYFRYPTAVHQGGWDRWTVTDFVSGDYFSVLGTRATRGRLLTPADDAPSAPPVAVVSFALWRDQLGSDANIIGQPMVINRQAVTVVGIAPDGFRGPLLDWYGQWSVDVFLPLGALDGAVPRPGILQDRQFISPMVIGRLQPGFTLEAAEAALIARAQQLEATFPQTNNGRTLIVLPAQRARFSPARWEATTRLLSILFASTCLILFLCSCNVVSLLIARAHARSHEIAVRVALGASHGRLLRRSFVDSALLVGGGSLAGFALAAVFVRMISAYPAPFQVPFFQAVNLDHRSLGFGLMVSAVVACLVTIAPAFIVTQQSPLGALKESLRSGHPGRALVRRCLVILEVAVSVIVLAGAALLSASLYYLGSRDPGFATNHVTLMALDAEIAYKEQRNIQGDFERLVDSVRTVPGVTAVSLGDPPLGAQRLRTGISTVAQRTQAMEPVATLYHPVAPGYFETLQIQMVRGRDFSSVTDTRTAVIVNQALAEHLWPGRDPLGEEVFAQGETTARRVIGVVRNVPYNDLWEAPQACAYLPLFRNQMFAANLLVRTNGVTPLASLQESLRSALTHTSSNLAIVEIKTMTQHLATQLSRQRLAAIVAVILGPAALVLVMVGLSGLLTFMVQQQTREIGIRMALGASGRSVAFAIVRRTGMMVGAGIVAGVLAWFRLQGFLRDEIHGVSPTAPLVLIAVIGIIIVFTLLVTYRPAQRAAKIDPVRALRFE